MIGNGMDWISPGGLRYRATCGANKWLPSNLMVLQFIAGAPFVNPAAPGSEGEVPSAELCNQIESDQCNHNQQCAICSNAKSNYTNGG